MSFHCYLDFIACAASWRFALYFRIDPSVHFPQGERVRGNYDIL